MVEFIGARGDNTDSARGNEGDSLEYIYLCILAFIVVLAAVSAIISARRRMKRKKAGINAICSALGTAFDRARFGGDGYEDVFRGRRGPYAFAARFTALQNMLTPKFLRLAFNARAPFKLRIWKKTLIRTLWRRAGLTVYLETGDPQFDTRFIVDSDNPDRAALYLADNSVRAALSAIFTVSGLKIRRITFAPKVVEVYVASFRPEEAEPEGVKGLVLSVVKLLEMGKGMGPMHIEPGAAPEWEGRLPSAALSLIGAFLGFLLLPVFLIYAFVDYNPLQRTIYYDAFRLAAIPVILIMAASFVALRHKWAALEKFKLLSGLAILFVPFLVMDAMYLANGYFDRSRPEVRTVPIVEKSWNLKRGGGRVYFESWKDGKRKYVELGRASYDKAKVGAPLAIETKAGYLGYEWISDFTIKEGE